MLAPLRAPASACTVPPKFRRWSSILWTG